MADTHTPSLRLRLLEVGANEDTWGDELNANVISMIEEAVAGIASVSVTAGNVALSTANGTTDQARNALIVFTGTPGATRTATFPDVEKLTWVYNNSDSSATLTAGAGTTVGLQAGSVALVYTDGATNVTAVLIAPVDGTHVTTSATQTLSNKTLSSPVLSGTATLPGGMTLADNGAGTGIGLVNTLNGQSGINFTNASSGTGARTQVRAFNDAGAAAVVMVAGSGNTIASLFETANRASVWTQAAAGMSVGTSVNQPLIFGVNNTEVARFDPSKLDLAVGQIKFPASQNASADANTLDDYEEGTFTPTIGDGTNSYSTTVALGHYTKIGDLVTAIIRLSWNGLGSAGAGGIIIKTLPFTSKNVTSLAHSINLGIIEGVNTILGGVDKQLVADLGPGASQITIWHVNDNANETAVAANSSSPTGAIALTVLYKT